MNETFTRFGACTISKNLYNGTSPLKYCIREDAKADIDSGWIFFTDVDTEDCFNDSTNWVIVPLEKVVELEPAILPIFNFSVGTELTLLKENGVLSFYDTNTGKKVELY